METLLCESGRVILGYTVNACLYTLSITVRKLSGLEYNMVCSLVLKNSDQTCKNRACGYALLHSITILCAGTEYLYRTNVSYAWKIHCQS